MKLCLASSAGGHLKELLQLRQVFEKRDHFFLTFRREDSKELRGTVYFITDPKRSPTGVLKNALQGLAVLLRERPDVVITTGAGVVVPFCILARLAGARLVFIESFCRVRQPSLTGRLLYPFASLFLVQWEDLLTAYGPKARYWGGVL
ncbi:MAG: polysaccharide biosynthesis protein [Candidatus Aenigmarchaeota archaeon]|nr:polysaccharide biosynthesis protein [Candidatus Aenigmarchaeota archaeon]